MREGASAPPAGAPRLDCAAVVLAAGQSRRMAGRNKLLAPVEGTPMIGRVVDTALESRAGPVIVVLGHEAEAVRAALSDRPVTFAFNPDYADGMASSLKAGIAAVPESAAAAIVLLGDMPRIRADTLDALIDALAGSPGAGAALPVYDAKRGNPVIWRRRYFAELMTLTGDRGGKPLLERLGEENVVAVPVDDPGVLLDIDSPDAL